MRRAARAAAALALASASTAALAGPDSRLLAVDRDADQLLVIDPLAMSLLHRVDVGDGPHEVAGSADGRLAYVANYGTGETPGSSISIVDLGTGRETERVSVKPFLRPHGLEIVGDKLYFTAEGSRSVARLDLATRQVDWTVGTGQAISHMLDVSSDGRRVYTTNMFSDTVTALEVEAPPHAPLQHAATGRMPEGIALSPDDSTLWVGQNGIGKISVRDAQTLVERQQVDAGAYPGRIRFSADGTRVFTTDPKTSELIVFDADTAAIVERVPVAGVPLGMWPSADGKWMYLTLAASGAIARVDLATFAVDRELDVGQVADGIGWAGPG